jgi:hypothetical protein
MAVVRVVAEVPTRGALELDPGVGTDAAWEAVEVLLQDEEWLRREFDALTASLEQRVPPRPPRHPAHPDGSPSPRSWARRWHGPRPAPAAAPGSHVPGRERSPPG